MVVSEQFMKLLAFPASVSSSDIMILHMILMTVSSSCDCVSSSYDGCYACELYIL